MMKTSFLERYRIHLHIFFWIFLVIYEGLIWGMVDGVYSDRLISSFVELPVKAAATYFTLYVLIDRFLVRKRYTSFLLYLVLSVAGFGILLRVVAFYILYPIFYPAGVSIPLFFLPKILIAVFSIYSLVAIVATFHIMKHWYRNQHAAQVLEQTTQQLEKEKLEAELKLLKSQINPHFLFNTLNNLYVLTLNNSARAPEMVYKLSQLMSYMLYESNQQEMLLEREVEYIENYLSLERIRYDSRVDISLTADKNTGDITIAPLLILPFVENSFKHGISSQVERGWVHVDVSIEEGVLSIKVENSKSQQHREKQAPSGIGLQNLQKRLELLYAGRFALHLFDEDDSFLAVLKITLVDNALGPRPLKKVKVQETLTY